MTAKTIVTKESLIALLNRNPEFAKRVVGKALVALYQRQTAAEQNTDSTSESNNVGFCGSDAKSGSKTAKFFLKHGTLLDWQLDAWIRPDRSGNPRISKYHRQLNEIASEKESRQARLPI